MSISRKLVHGSFWNGLNQFFTQVINFSLTIVLARLLEPGDFGLIGKVIVITGFLGYFTEFGLIPSLLLRKNADKLDFNSVFWGSMVLALIMYSIIFFSAPYLSKFYDDMRLIILFRIIFIDFLFKPLTFIPTVIENKKLEYKRLALNDLIATLVSGILSVSAAFLNFGVWALVIQTVSRNLVMGILFSLTIKWEFSFLFSFERFKFLFGTGIHFAINNLVKFFAENVDFLLVGKFAGDSALGIYTFAFKISRYPLMKVWMVFGRMLFPAFTRINENINKIKNNYLKIFSISVVVITPLLLFIEFSIPYLITILVGDKWIAAVPIIRILLFYAFLEAISLADVSILNALHMVKKVNLIKFCTSILLIPFGYYALIRWGLLGITLAYTLLNGTQILLIKYIVVKKLSLNFKMVSKFFIWFSFLCSLSTLIISILHYLLIKVSLNSYLSLTMLTILFLLSNFFILIKIGFLAVKPLSINWKFYLIEK